MSTATDVAIVDNGGANIASLCYALERIGAAARLVSDPRELGRARRVILPGVGAAGDAMRRLESLDLVDAIRSLGQPVLGICLGMQLLFEASDEGDTRCLGVMSGRARRFSEREGFPVPHMGWNRLEFTGSDALLTDVEPGQHVYFVHSYALPPGEATVATADYGGAFSAIVRRGNFTGTQFHPERSGPAGARILANFLERG